MEIDEVKEYYVNMWKQKFEELNELTIFIQSLNQKFQLFIQKIKLPPDSISMIFFHQYVYTCDHQNTIMSFKINPHVGVDKIGK